MPVGQNIFPCKNEVVQDLLQETIWEYLMHKHWIGFNLKLQTHNVTIDTEISPWNVSACT